MHHQLFSEYLKAGNLLKLKNLKETGTVCKLKYFLIYRESYRHRNIEQCYRISHILLISCRPTLSHYPDQNRSFGNRAFSRTAPRLWNSPPTCPRLNLTPHIQVPSENLPLFPSLRPPLPITAVLSLPPVFHSIILLFVVSPSPPPVCLFTLSLYASLGR